MAFRLTDQQVEDLRETFAELDAGNNGSISKMDVRRAMQQSGRSISDADLGQLMKSVDQDRSGVISFEEFLEVMARHMALAEGISEQDIFREAFDTLDIRRIGRITWADFKTLLMTRGDAMTKEEVRFIVDLSGEDDRGEIDFAAFCKLLTM
mmetsp:Transcript_87806/g.171756  ORF Transcript_87806/g.171756 Transcript_87806/m.171756 type:complete len:152 (-) Transcript_87806:93-548(-)